MIRRIATCLALWACLITRVAFAQTSTADGLKAFIRSDYQTAARILRPLAEKTPDPDPLAQFFMATLYDSGLGVERSEDQACTLYTRAAAPANPLMNQALTLAEVIRKQSPLAARLCDLAFSDDDRLLQPVSFSLGADHSVSVDRGGVTVNYNGAQTRTQMLMDGIDWVTLPIRQTSMTVSRPAPTRRHFIEWFVWRPVKTPERSSWTLGWALFEVRGANFVYIIAEDVTTVDAVQPPKGSDSRDAVQIRLDSNGEAEWVIAGDPPRSGVMPTGGP